MPFKRQQFTIWSMADAGLAARHEFEWSALQWEDIQMIEQALEIATTDGVMNTVLTRPDRQGAFPVVLFLMDAPGKLEEAHDMARRIATVGYYVMVPNHITVALAGRHGA